MVEMKNAYGVLVEKSEGKSSLLRSRNRWVDKINNVSLY
jgi:hypothetical protein